MRPELSLVTVFIGGCLFMVAAFSHADNLQRVPLSGGGAVSTFELETQTGNLWIRLKMPYTHQVPCYGRLEDSAGELIGYFYADGLHADQDGTAIAPGGHSAWVDMVPYIHDGRGDFTLTGMFDEGKRVSGWSVIVQASTDEQPPEETESIPRLVWPSPLRMRVERYVGRPFDPYRDWTDITAVMQPWRGIFSEAMILDRNEWIKRLRDELGIGAVIFIPPTGDIEPNYPMYVYREAVDEYHARGLRVLMYWSIMHMGHHNLWHQVTENHPDWAQRDIAGNPITRYGDLWLCPNTDALDFSINTGCDLLRRMDADGIMLDNNSFGVGPAGPTGYCSGCREAFAEWIGEQFDDHQLRMMGIDDDNIPLPAPGDVLYPYWREWRYHTWAEATDEFRRAVHHRQPGAILCANTQYYAPWEYAVHEEPLAEDLIFSESRNRFGSSMSVKLLYGRALGRGRPVWNYLGTWDEEDITRLAPAGIIEDAICTTWAKAASPWLVGYGFVQKPGLAGWTHASYENAEGGEVEGDDRESLTGDRSLRIELPEPGRLSAYQKGFVPVEPGQIYDFSCMVRENSVRPGRARIRLTFLTPDGQAAAEPFTFYLDAPGGTHNWVKLAQGNIPAPENAIQVNVEAFLWGARGRAWFDDMYFGRFRGGENLLNNPGFEIEYEPDQIEAYRAASRALTFGRDNRKYLKGLVPLNNVAVLASRHSTDYGGAPRVPAGVMRALLMYGVGFDVILEEDLNAWGLSGYDVLVMDQATCLQDDWIGSVATWVRSGGSLIFTGQTGAMDMFGVPVDTDRLAGALGRPREDLTEPTPLRRGTALWIPSTFEQTFAETGVKAAHQLATDVVNMGGGLVQIDSTPDLEVRCFAQPGFNRLVFTLDNQGENPPVGACTIRVPKLRGWSLSPTVLDMDGRGQFSQRFIHAGTSIEVENIRRFALVVVE